ncbi:MAG: hypothetical protein MJZ15_11460, partial [Bacteroidales bacterium]|nr:hypothetical protein [Bacteroidales bacterium]
VLFRPQEVSFPKASAKVDDYFLSTKCFAQIFLQEYCHFNITAYKWHFYNPVKICFTYFLVLGAPL